MTAAGGRFRTGPGRRSPLPAADYQPPAPVRPGAGGPQVTFDGDDGRRRVFRFTGLPAAGWHEPAIDHTDRRRFADLEAAYPGERDLLLVAEESGSAAGAAMGFVSSGPEVTLRILAVAAGRRRQGIGRALLRAFEASALRLGAARISLGADAEAGFYVRHGYQTMLLLQWAYDPGRFDAEVEALAAGPVKEMTWHRDSFGGVPQLFVELDEPSPVVRAQVQDLVSGAHVGYCMTKAISAQNEPATPGPG